MRNRIYDSDLEEKRPTGKLKDPLNSDYLEEARGEVEILMDYIAQVDMELKEVEMGLKRLLRRPF